MLRSALARALATAALVQPLGACRAPSAAPSGAARDASAPAPPTASTVSPPQPAIDAAGLACDEMTVSQCLASTECVLEPRGPDAGWTPRYVCRPATLPCEKGHPQTDKAACEKIAGCAFQQPACFCPGSGDTKVPDHTVQPIECYCGGGSPGACVKAGTSR